MRSTHFDFQQQLTKQCVIFWLLVLFFFLPIEFNFKIGLPMTSLFLFSWLFLPGAFASGTLFSAAGDFFGAANNFYGQMGAFAIAHISYIIYFWRLRCQLHLPLHLRSRHFTLTALFTFVIFIAVCIVILPHVGNLFLTIATAIYAVLILLMFWNTLQINNALFIFGALLFVASDGILAYNKFVEHIPGATYYIMCPYYLGQFLLFLGAAYKTLQKRNY